MEEMGGTEYLIYKGSDLKWILPHIYVLTENGNKVYVISPWIDVRVRLNVTWVSEHSEYTLMELAKIFMRRNIKTVFVFSETEKDSEINNESINMLSGSNFEVLFVRNLHAKAIIGQRLMYLGSANITYSGLYRNTEAATLSAVNDQQESLTQIFGEAGLWQLQKAR